jgi:hypothetical protein
VKKMSRPGSLSAVAWVASCGAMLLTSGCGSAGGAGSGGAGSGGSTGCSAYPGAAFCDDFETAGTFAQNWPNPTGTLPLVVASPTAYSPAHVASLVSTTTNSNMFHSLPTILASQKLRIAFSVRVVDAPRGYALLANPSLDSTGTMEDLGLQVTVALDAGQLAVELLNNSGLTEPADGGPDLPVAPFPVGTWMRVELDVDVSDAGSVKVLVNGALKATLPYVPAETGYTGSYEGDLMLSATTSTSVEYDDIVVWQD